MTQPKFQDQRKSRRYSAGMAGDLFNNSQRIPVVIYDLSAGGAKIRLPDSATHHDIRQGWRLDIPLVSILPLDVRWRDGNLIGVLFTLLDSEREGLSALLDSALAGSWDEQIRSGGDPLG